jgi:hypothetical protein
LEGGTQTATAKQPLRGERRSAWPSNVFSSIRRTTLPPRACPFSMGMIDTESRGVDEFLGTERAAPALQAVAAVWGGGAALRLDPNRYTVDRRPWTVYRIP